MLTDRYGLAVSTTSSVAREAYCEGCDLLLTLYPGAVAAFDRALSADPGLAAAHIGKARAQQLGSDALSARASLAAAQALPGASAARDLSQIEVFRFLLAGQSDAAFAAVRAHLDAWPRDALVLSTTSNQIGLIGLSGRAGREQELADFLGTFASHYGDDWWFNSHYAMALSETSKQAAARPRIERSMAQNPRNAYGAHALTHLHYETGEHDAAITFMHSWLPTYGRDGMLYGHLNWHLALFEMQRGNISEAFRLYTEAFASNDYPGPALIKLLDAASFLWRSELAGHSCDMDRWRTLHEFAHSMFPRAGMPFADWHVALVNAATDDNDALDRSVHEMDELVRAGCYPAGPAVPALARAFAAFRRQDFVTAIDAMEPMMPERERICGSRAQVDLVEATLLKAYLGAGRLNDVRRLLRDRRPGPAELPVAGLELLH
jgi:tetratricopeptide (TPR) repeat protein